MKYKIVALLLWLPFLSKSQNTLRTTLETSSGYEYNVFNAGENKIAVSEDGDTISAIQSGFFQKIGFGTKWKVKSKSNTIDFNVKARYDYFPFLQDANLFRPEAGLRYSYSFSKKSSIYLNGKYLIYQTNAINDDEEVISAPNAYGRWNADIGLKLKPFRHNQTRLEMKVIRKKYAEKEDGQLQYDAYGLHFQTKQRLKKKNKRSHYLSFDYDFLQRNYLDISFELNEEDEPYDEITERNWQYHTAGLFYSMNVSKGMTWKSGIAYQQRLDISDQKYGYHEWESFSQLKWKTESLIIALKAKADFRYYSDLKAGSSSDELLKHKYATINFEVEQILNEYFRFIIRSKLRKRWRNLSEEATSYLPYTNAIFSIGLKSRF